MEDSNKRWLQLLSAAAAIATILGFLILIIPHGSSGSTTETFNNGQSGGTTSNSPTDSGVPSTPVPSPTPTAVAKLNPGTVLYQANWSGGMGGWSADSNWNVLNGALVTNGQSYGNSYTQGTAYPPYQPGDNVTDYSIEARIQVVASAGSPAGFGIIARLTPDTSDSSADGYIGGIDTIDKDPPYSALADIHSGEPWADPCCVQSHFYTQTPFTPGGNWHTYRLVVQANHISFYIDGGLVGQVTDNQFLRGGRVGLDSYQCQIEVSSFTVTAT